uniref:Uncharacterized protein n=1 Tax=viral metagenome TaxID=1070528 RepID=A0A6C0ASQ2_9ZZZZ
MPTTFTEDGIVVVRQLTQTGGGPPVVLPPDTVVGYLVVGSGGSGGIGGDGGEVKSGAFVTPSTPVEATFIVPAPVLPGQLGDDTMLILNNGLPVIVSRGGGSGPFSNFTNAFGGAGHGGPGLEGIAGRAGRGGPGVPVTLWNGETRVYGAGGAGSVGPGFLQALPVDTGGGAGSIHAVVNSGSGGAGGTPDNPSGGTGAIGQISLWYRDPAQPVLELDPGLPGVVTDEDTGGTTYEVDTEVFTVDAASGGGGGAEVYPTAAVSAQRIVQASQVASSSDLFNVSTNATLQAAVERAAPVTMNVLRVAAGKPRTYTRTTSPLISVTNAEQSSIYGNTVRFTPLQAAAVIAVRDDPALTPETVQYALDVGVPRFFIQDMATRAESLARKRVFAAAGIEFVAAPFNRYF